MTRLLEFQLGSELRVHEMNIPGIPRRFPDLGCEIPGSELFRDFGLPKNATRKGREVYAGGTTEVGSFGSKPAGDAKSSQNSRKFGPVLPIFNEFRSPNRKMPIIPAL